MQPEKQGMTEEYRMYSPCPPSVPVSVPIPILHILPPVPPVSASYSFSNPSDREKQGYNGNMGTGAMMQETGCTILQKPLKKPPVPAHPPIRETCAFSQYGSILRTKKRAVAAITALSSQISTF